MKRTTTLTLLLILGMGGLSAQCSSEIPANATIVTGNSWQTVNEDNIWICSGAENWIIEGDGNIWLEEGADVNLNPSNATIYYNGSTQVIVGGNNNTAYADTSWNLILWTGSGNFTFSCGEDSTVFSYDLLGISDCTTLGMNDHAQIEIGLSPNPVTDVLRIDAGAFAIRSVQIFDLEGRLVAHHQSNDLNSIPVPELEPGIYLLSIVTDQGTSVDRFMKI